MSASTIGWLVSIFFIFVLVICFFVGFWRGLRKSTANLVFSVIGALVAFFVTPSIAGAALGIRVNLDGENLTLSDYIINSLTENEDISVIMDRNPNLGTLIEGLPNALVSTVIFLLVTLAIELVIYIIYRIVACFTFKTPLGASKHRVWGGAVGLAKGFVLTLFAFMPLAGLIGTYDTLKNSQTNYLLPTAQIESNASLLDEVPKEIDEIMTGLQDNALVWMCGVFGLDNATFDYLSKVDVEGENVYIRQEVVNIYPLANFSYQLSNSENVSIDFVDINYDELEKVLNEFVDGGLYKSIVVNLASDIVLNYQDYPFIGESQDLGEFEDILKEIQATLAEYSQSNAMLERYFTNDIKNIFNTVKVLGSSGTLDEVVSQSDAEGVINVLFSDGNISNTELALNYLFDMNSVRDAIVPLANMAVEQISTDLDQVGADSSTWGEQDWDDLASSIINIANDYIELSDIIDIEEVVETPEILVQDTSYDIAKITSLLGNLVDEARGVKLLQTLDGTSILDSFLSENGIALPDENVKYIDGSGLVQETSITNYSQLLEFVTPALVTIQENDFYNILNDTADATALMTSLADLLSQEGKEDILLDIILPLSQVEPTKTFVVEDLIKTIDNNFVNFASLNSFEDWQSDLTYVSELLITMNSNLIGDTTYLEYAINGDLDSILSDVTDSELESILLPVLYAKSTQGLRDDIFAVLTDVADSLTSSSNTIDLTNVTLVEGSSEDQAQEICDIFASFLSINDEFSSGMSLRDLNKDNLASFFTSVQENAYRTTLFGKTEEGVFNGVFVNLVNSLKSAYQSEIEQSTTLQEMLSEDNYPNIDFVQVFELLSSLEESIG